MLCQSPSTVEMAPGAQPGDMWLGSSSRPRPSPREPTAVEHGATLCLPRWWPWDSWRREKLDPGRHKLPARFHPRMSNSGERREMNIKDIFKGGRKAKVNMQLFGW